PGTAAGRSPPCRRRGGRRAKPAARADGTPRRSSVLLGRAGPGTTTAPHPEEGAAPSGGPDQRPATCLASFDLRWAAWLAWMTPLLTALSSLRPAACSAVVAASLSPAAIASRTRRT